MKTKSIDAGKDIAKEAKNAGVLLLRKLKKSINFQELVCKF